LSIFANVVSHDKWLNVDFSLTCDLSKFFVNLVCKNSHSLVSMDSITCNIDEIRKNNDLRLVFLMGSLINLDYVQCMIKL